MIKSIKKISKILIIIIFVLVFIISICPIELQNDTFFDISLGREYIENGMSKIDGFSVHENLKYQTHHLIPSVIIYTIYNMFNFIGLHIFEIILTCIIAFLFYLINNQYTKNKSMAYIMIFLEIFMFSMFISLRAQMFSTIIFLLEIFLVNKYLYKKLSKKRDNIILITLTLLPIVLINFHSGVIFFYYIIMIVYLLNLNKIKLIRIEDDGDIDKTKLKKLLIVSVISLPLLIFNPYGIDGITYMFKTLNNSVINANIQEFQPFSLRNSLGVNITIYFAIHIISLILSDRKIKIAQILFFIGTLFMTLLAVRHFIFYVITTIVLIPHIEFLLTKIKKWLYNDLNEKGLRAMTITIYIVMGFILTVNIFGNLANKSYSFVPAKVYPIEAIEYIKSNIGYDEVIFNEYAWGSYMMLNNIKVFIDSRCDLYTTEYNKGVTIAEDYMKTIKGEVHYGDMADKYRIKYFFIPKNKSLAVMLLKDNNYDNIYEDELTYIFKKK